MKPSTVTSSAPETKTPFCIAPRARSSTFDGSCLLPTSFRYFFLAPLMRTASR